MSVVSASRSLLGSIAIVVVLAVNGEAVVCGDPLAVMAGLPRSWATTASDALFTLQSAVGSATCQLCACDVDGSGAVTASDALLVLKLAIGEVVTKACPPCGATTSTLSTTTSTALFCEEPRGIVDKAAGIAFRVRPSGCEIVDVFWNVSGSVLAAGAEEFTIQLYVGGGQMWQDQVFTEESSDQGIPVRFGGVPSDFCFRMIATASGSSSILGSGTSGNEAPCL
jgi:hypothetical protein